MPTKKSLALIPALAGLLLVTLAGAALSQVSTDTGKPDPSLVGIPLEKGEFDPAPFDALLKQYVKDGRVDYAAWKAEGIEKLDAFLNAAAGYDLNSTMGKEPRAAFLINAYNAWAIRQVLEHYPVDSVSKIPGFFDKNVHRIAGKDRTLDGIEADLAGILPHLPTFAMALSPATLGGPKLSENAFYGKDFDKLLSKSIQSYVTKDKKIHYDAAEEVLHIPPRVSRHMDLYEKLPKGLGEALADYLPLSELVAINFKKPKQVIDPEDDHLNDTAGAVPAADTEEKP